MRVIICIDLGHCQTSATFIKITEDGKYIFDTSLDSNGGHIFKSQRGGALAVLPKNGYLLYSKEKGIIGITEKQLYLLYEEKK